MASQDSSGSESVLLSCSVTWHTINMTHWGGESLTWNTLNVLVMYNTP